MYAHVGKEKHALVFNLYKHFDTYWYLIGSVFPTGAVITLMNVASTSVEVTNVTQAVVCRTHKGLEVNGRHHFEHLL